MTSTAHLVVLRVVVDRQLRSVADASGQLVLELPRQQVRPAVRVVVVIVLLVVGLVHGASAEEPEGDKKRVRRVHLFLGVDNNVQRVHFLGVDNRVQKGALYWG